MNLRSILSAFLVSSLLISCHRGNESDLPATPPPNIIFIMADDLGYGDVGAYGSSKISTPGIDRMAAEGMVFTDFYAGTAVCAPSRSSLITGLHTGHTPIRGNKQYGSRNGQYPLPDSAKTVAEYLKDYGYTTAMIGKWGLGDNNTEGNPNNQGWDYFFGYTDQVLAHNHFPEYLWRNREKVYLSNEVKYLDTTYWHKGLGSYSTKKAEYAGDLFYEEAKKFIAENQSNPFFLYLPVVAPHDNGEAPKDDVFEVPDQGRYADEDWPKIYRDYAALITEMDKGVGEILELLNSLQIDEQTLIVFTSDNGPFQARGLKEFFDSNGPLRGGKRDLYEGGIRVPFVVRWTGKVEAGSTSSFQGGFWDMLPTFVEMAGGSVEASKTDGISILPELLGKDQPQHDYLYWEFHEKNGAQAIRKGDWKAVRNNAITEPLNPPELYNLATDIGEENNVAGQHPEIVRELDSLMFFARTHSKIFPFYGPEMSFK